MVGMLHKERIGSNHGEKTTHNQEYSDEQTNDLHNCELPQTAGF